MLSVVVLFDDVTVEDSLAILGLVEVVFVTMFVFEMFMLLSIINVDII